MLSGTIRVSRFRGDCATCTAELHDVIPSLVQNDDMGLDTVPSEASNQSRKKFDCFSTGLLPLPMTSPLLALRLPQLRETTRRKRNSRRPPPRSEEILDKSLLTLGPCAMLALVLTCRSTQQSSNRQSFLIFASLPYMYVFHSITFNTSPVILTFRVF